MVNESTRQRNKVRSQLLKTGVGVERLDLSKLVEKTLRQEAMQAAFPS